MSNWLSVLRCYNQGVDGVVIAGAADSSDALRQLAEEKGFRSYLPHEPVTDDVDTVRPDNMQAAQLLVEHLIRHGHQRIAWLGTEFFFNPRRACRRLLCDAAKIWFTVS